MASAQQELIAMNATLIQLSTKMDYVATKDDVRKTVEEHRKQYHPVEYYPFGRIKPSDAPPKRNSRILERAIAALIGALAVWITTMVTG